MTSDGCLEVVFVINGLGTGGAERSLAEILPLYLERNVRPRVVCLYERSTGVQDLVSALDVPITVLRSSSSPGRTVELVKLLRSWSPDLVVTTIFEADLIGRLAGRMTGTATLTSLVNTPNSPARRRDPNIRAWKLAMARLVDTLMARTMTDHFHAITEAVKQDALANYRIDDRLVTVIPRGRDPHRLGQATPERRSATRKSMGVSETTPLALVVGRQEYQKGHRYLLAAMPEVLVHLPDLEVWLAGRPGAETISIKNAIESNDLGDHVHLLGHRNDVPDLMAAADILVFPSLYEGLGGTLIEAFALEVPIVASCIPAIEEVTQNGRCATLVPAGDPTALAKAVVQILTDTHSAADQTAAGLHRFENLYTIERIADQMVDLMREVGATR